jgi:hypothetical protein
MACTAPSSDTEESEQPSLSRDANPVDTTWYKGFVDLPATATKQFGLVGFGKPYKFWIPYMYSSSQISKGDSVYFQVSHLDLGAISDQRKLAMGVRLTETPPAMGLSTSFSSLEPSAFRAHDLFPHDEEDNSYHKPGCIIRVTNTKFNVEISIGGQQKVEEFTLVNFKYTDSTQSDIFVPTGWISSLSTNELKNYYPDYYTQTIIPPEATTSYKVLRSFSVEHYHPGHSEEVTIKLVQN